MKQIIIAAFYLAVLLSPEAFSQQKQTPTKKKLQLLIQQNGDGIIILLTGILHIGIHIMLYRSYRAATNVFRKEEVSTPARILRLLNFYQKGKNHLLLL